MTLERHISEILEKIKTGKQLSYTEKQTIKLKHLLTTDSNNITYLEYACKLKIELSESLCDEIANNKKALLIIINNNCIYEFLPLKNEDIAFEQLENNKTLIDIMLNNNNSNYLTLFLTSFQKHIEIIDYLIKYKKEQYYDALAEEIADLLFIEKDSKYPIDKYINIDSLIKSIIPKVTINLLINYCHKKRNYELLKYIKEEYLLKEIDNKTILEVLLDNNIDPLFINYKIKNKDTLNILIKKDRYDLLYNADINILLSNYNSNKTYFDLIVEKHKNGQNMNIEKISNNYNRNSSEITAKKILYMAQNNILGYIPKITSNMLLYKGVKDKKTVLQWLIEINKTITITKIIPKCIDKGNPNLIITLKKMNINVASPIAIEYEEKDSIADKITTNYNKEYTEGCTSICEELLIELKELFYTDEKSDKDLIDTIIASYRYLTRTNNTLIIEELKKLIKIKKNNPNNFIITKGSSKFSSKTGEINLSNNIINEINHEITHALHYYLTNNEIPNNLNEIIKRIRENPQTIEMVAKYSKEYKEIRKKLREAVNKTLKSESLSSKYTDEEKEKIIRFLAESKEKKKQELKGQLTEEELDTILEETYTLDEFIQQRQKIETMEIETTILKNKHGAFLAIGDIIDAIFLGKYSNEVLLHNGRKIRASYGHGIEYYLNEELLFIEMIANYGVIIKSKENKDELLKKLRGITGDELIDLLDEFYTKKIIGSKVYDIDKEEEKDHAR